MFDYVPGRRRDRHREGRVRGTLEGADFMRVLFENHLGASPPSAPLRDGMLGA